MGINRIQARVGKKAFRIGASGLAAVFFAAGLWQTGVRPAAAEAGAPTAAQPSPVAAAVARVTPSVVGVLNLQKRAPKNGPPVWELSGVGSGAIFSKQGYIITNNHVVQGAQLVEVILASRRHVTARVVGTDPLTDLAVLKIPAEYVGPRSVAVFGNSANLRPGETAIAVGYPAGVDFADTATAGIISAVERVMPVMNTATGKPLAEEPVLQTDAAINPGNSGGPLCDLSGRVIGIDSSKISAQGFEGMGFAIPSNLALSIAEEIIATGKALHPDLGVQAVSLWAVPGPYQPKVPVFSGAEVVALTGKNAIAAGIRPGDVIVSIGGRPVDGSTALLAALLQYFHPGQTVSVVFYRGMTKMSAMVRLDQKEAMTGAGA